MRDTPTIGIGKLLTESAKFSVPIHQRDFSWTEDEIEQFIEDILEAKKLKQKDFFFGLMVFMPGDDDNQYVILDGQQRIVTTTIVLSAIRSWLSSYGFIEEEAKVQSEFIAVKDFGEDKFEPRVILNYNNNDVFYKYVVNEAPLEDVEIHLSKLNQNHHDFNLTKAISYGRQRINKIFALNDREKEQVAKEIFSLVKYIRDNVKVVTLHVENEANAFTVFETLNDRGLDLSALDLIKNHLFGKARDKVNLEVIQTRWVQMMVYLLSIKSEDFLKTYWTSRYGRTQISTIFAAFKANVNSWDDAMHVSEDMLTSAEQYSAIYVSDHPLWNNYDKSTKRLIRNLGIIGSKQLPAVILSALTAFKPIEFTKLLKLLEVLIVRFQLIQGGRTGLLEIACNRLAKMIYDGKVTKASHARSELNTIMPTDNEFKEYFKIKQEQNSRKALYILKEIERQKRIEEETYSDIDLPDTITVEHILPKNPNESWSQFYNDSERNVKDYIYRLGNICLLDSKSHKSGAKGFSLKRNDYLNSSLLTTKEVISYESWNFENIETRQSDMADLAVKVWSVHAI